MIEISQNNFSTPYQSFYSLLKSAIDKNQKDLDVIAISSFNSIEEEVSCRYVNLKYIIDDEWIFFSNYNSTKARDFKTHPQISATIYWNAINVQIRIKANIKITDKDISDKHFLLRSKEKNALAISSKQSQISKTYDDVIRNYSDQLSKPNNHERPLYWGGYSFTPYYFEFWEGHASRLNKRDVYQLVGSDWNHHALQP